MIPVKLAADDADAGHGSGSVIFWLQENSWKTAYGHISDEHEVTVLVLVGNGELAIAASVRGGGREALGEEEIQCLPEFSVALTHLEINLPQGL
uniref:Uncharacterized protein n=1 Tax=Oryza punctata TaxID=4537 RepID=A0A0E0LHV8_ORYPU